MDKEPWNVCYNVIKMVILFMFIIKQQNIVQMIANMHKHKMVNNVILTTIILEC